MRFVHAARAFRDHGFLGRAHGSRFISESFNGRIVAVGRDERCQRLHEVPGRTVHARFVGRVDVFTRPAAPAFTAGRQFQLDHAFRAEADGDDTIETLHCGRHENPGAT